MWNSFNLDTVLLIIMSLDLQLDDSIDFRVYLLRIYIEYTSFFWAREDILPHVPLIQVAVDVCVHQKPNVIASAPSLGC